MGYWVYTSNHSRRLDAEVSDQDLIVRMKKRTEKRKRVKGEEMMEGRKVEERMRKKGLIEFSQIIAKNYFIAS